MLSNLQTAQDYVARCIAAGDESLLPLFERLEREIVEIERKEDLLSKAYKIAATSERRNVISLSNKSKFSDDTSSAPPAAWRRHNADDAEYA